MNPKLLGFPKNCLHLNHFYKQQEDHQLGLNTTGHRLSSMVQSICFCSSQIVTNISNLWYLCSDWVKPETKAGKLSSSLLLFTFGIVTVITVERHKNHNPFSGFLIVPCLSHAQEPPEPVKPVKGPPHVKYPGEDFCKKFKPSKKSWPVPNPDDCILEMIDTLLKVG